MSKGKNLFKLLFTFSFLSTSLLLLSFDISLITFIFSLSDFSLDLTFKLPLFIILLFSLILFSSSSLFIIILFNFSSKLFISSSDVDNFSLLLIFSSHSFLFSSPSNFNFLKSENIFVISLFSKKNFWFLFIMLFI